LICLGANYPQNSEYALISLEILPDFDSTMRRFESSRPSQAVWRLEILPLAMLEMRANGGLLQICGRSQDTKLGHFREKSPIVSGGYLKYSRFWETLTGDRVRSALRGGRGSAWELERPLLGFHLG
jgi:hypothetical protein